MKKEKTNVVTIGSVEELQALVDAPVYCEFKLDGRLVRVPCKRVTQEMDEQVRAIRREAVPPFLKERGKNGEYDYGNAAYLAKKDQDEKIARAMIIYAGCPAVAMKSPGLTDRMQIYQLVKGLWTEPILEFVASTIAVGGIELLAAQERDRVNFTSPGSSES